MVQFTVEPDGSVQNVKLIRGVHPLLDNEALRVVSASPKWTPGYQNGQSVRVTFSFPLIYCLQ